MNLNRAAFSYGVFASLSTGLILIVFSFLGGKEDLFLLLNADLGRMADHLFHYLTYLGDGIIWVPFAIWVLVYRKKMWPLVISAIVFSTFLVQFSKQVIFTNEARPTKSITEMALIHTVEGVELHTNNSFPSGHNTTAFSIFLLLCLLLSARYFWIPGFLLAVLTGYSRIYLAQHFPLDAGAGMIAAVISVYASLWVQERIDARYNPASAEMNQIH